MNTGSLNQIDQQAENTLLRLQKLWQITNSLTNSQQQPLSEALQARFQSIEEQLVAIEDQFWQDENLADRRENLSLLYRQVVERNTTLESLVQEQTTQLQKYLNFEVMLKRISDDVRDTLDEKQILQAAVWELAVGLNIHGCNMGLYDALLVTSTISYEYTLSIDSACGQVIKMQDFSEGYQQLLQGQYFQFCELTASWQAPVTILACPIFDDRGTIGDLWLFKHPEAAFDELEIRLVQQVANQCAIAIRQARLYQAAQAKIPELETKNHLKDDFLDTVSHELRSPLANMKMAIEMLGIVLNQKQVSACLSGSGKEFEKISRYLQILHNECGRVSNPIANLLELQNLSSNSQPSLLTSIHLQEWLPQIAAPFQERSRHCQQSLSMEISPDLPRLICESAWLGRVLAELLHNACKYTPAAGKIVIKAKTFDQTSQQTPTTSPKTIQISVSNSGVEIPASEIPRIFDKFYRIRAHDVWNQGGTGLGLALVQQLVTRLGGKIFVNSSKGQTCFTVELPLKN